MKLGSLRKAVGLASLVIALGGCGAARPLGAPGFPEQWTDIEERLSSEQGFYAVYSGEFQLIRTYDDRAGIVTAYEDRDPGRITVCRFDGSGVAAECWNATGDLSDAENWREMAAPGELSYAHLRTNTL